MTILLKLSLRRARSYPTPGRTASVRITRRGFWMAKGLPYIPNKRLFAADKFSPSMQQGGMHPGVADASAGEHYGFARDTVSRYTLEAPPWMRGRGKSQRMLPVFMLRGIEAKYSDAVERANISF